MSSAMRACAVTLLDGDRLIARGMVVIDAEGVPPVIMFDGDAFLPVLETTDPTPDVQTYRKVRVMHAGDSFQAAMLTVVHR